jgi:putative transposase
MLSVVNDEGAVADGRSMLDEICREGAQKMLAAALEAEVEVYVADLLSERGDDGRRLVTRNGHARARTISTVAGAVEIRQPRVEDRFVDPVTGEKVRFTCSLVPPWCRKSPKVTEVLLLLYLHGLSTGTSSPPSRASSARQPGCRRR